MAQIPYRANLSAAVFPMTLARSGRSVIVPGADQQFDRRVDPAGEQKNAGIPQIIYAENVLPTVDGYQSIGFSDGGTFGPVAPGFSWVPLEINQGQSSVKKILLLIGAGIVYYTTNGITYTLVSVTGATPSGPGNFVSTATVRGICYVHVGTRIYTYAAGALTEVTASFLPGGILTNLICICGSFNYLVLLKSDGTVNWSSTTTPTDFTPSLVSGAGSGALTGNSGQPVCSKANPSGFYIYCRGNVISAEYTGNARYPWRFTPIQDSEGVLLTQHVGGEPTDSNNFILSNSGTLVQITPRSASLAAPEVSELLTRLKYRDIFDYTSNAFSVGAGTNYFTGRVQYLMNRFVILSGDLESTVFDAMLQRYGKINTDHNYIVDLEPLGTFTARTLVAINLVNGTTKIISQDPNDITSPHRGVILLGKFQYVRSRFLCLDEVSVESAQLSGLVPATSRNFQAYAIPTLDGKTFQSAQLLYSVPDSTTGDVMSYNSAAEGKNVSLLFKGAFDLTSVEMMFHLGGDC